MLRWLDKFIDMHCYCGGCVIYWDSLSNVMVWGYSDLSALVI